MSNLIKVFLIGFFCAFTLTSLISIFLYSVSKSLLLGSIIGFLYGLFSMGFMVRQLKRTKFVIDSSNKRVDKGLLWYEEKIKEQARDLRFKEIFRSDNKVVYRPSTLYRVFESEIIIELSPYDISISCSRMMMRIILDYIDFDSKGKV